MNSDYSNIFVKIDQITKQQQLKKYYDLILDYKFKIELIKSRIVDLQKTPKTADNQKIY